MLKTEFNGVNLALTAALEAYLERKLNRATKNFGEFVSGVRANLTYEPRHDRHRVH